MKKIDIKLFSKKCKLSPICILDKLHVIASLHISRQFQHVLKALLLWRFLNSKFSIVSTLAISSCRLQHYYIVSPSALLSYFLHWKTKEELQNTIQVEGNKIYCKCCGRHKENCYLKKSFIFSSLRHSSFLCNFRYSKCCFSPSSTLKHHLQVLTLYKTDINILTVIFTYFSIHIFIRVFQN